MLLIVITVYIMKVNEKKLRQEALSLPNPFPLFLLPISLFLILPSS